MALLLIWAALMALLHVTQISWRRVSHPTETLNAGDTIKVQVIRINPETQRVNLSMKHLETDPWQGVELRNIRSTWQRLGGV